MHNRTLDLLEQAGCQIDHAKQMACFPPTLVMEQVKQAPSSFNLGARDKKHDLEIGNGDVHTRCISGCFKILDYPTGHCRTGTTLDCAKSALLQDSLENVKLVAGLLYPFDVPPALRTITLLRQTLENSAKHIFLNVFGGQELNYLLQMLLVLVDKKTLAQRPLLSVNVTPVSPLTYSEDQLDVLFTAAEHGLPIQFGSTPITGASAPITLAGQLALIHAEILAGVVISQIIKPGSPAIYEPRPNTMDLRNANVLWGSIEWGITSSASKQLAELVALPADLSGATTESKTTDQQAAIEKAMNLSLIALSKPSIISGLGQLETINTASFEQLVIDSEICGMMYRVLKGIDVNEDTLATELIQRIGPGGSFLGERHTLDFYGNEHYLPTIFDRQIRENWVEAGEKDITAVASEKVQQLVANHRPVPLDPGTLKELDSICTQAKDELL